MIPGMLITRLVAPLMKKLLPMILDKVIRRFEGIEKMPKVVSYVEDENELDKGMKQLADELDTANNKMDKFNDVIDGLRKEIKELKNGK
tara:strand:+ start:757 stop:1023 length:267 start_codon:yes stop_codon:yes gene_type:complete